MNQLYPDEALVPILKKIAGGGGLKYKLFTNDVTPTLATELADLTEAAWAGYSEQLVEAADFTTTSVASHLGSIIAAPVMFGNSSGSSQSAYGYYVVDFDTNEFIAVARFDSAPVTIANGASLPVLPIYADFSGLSS